MLLTIEKLIYGGDGLARLPADEHGRGKAVFAPFVLEGEQVEASLVEEKPGFARARADRIAVASPFRIAPHCPYFIRCGGCHYQHTSYEHQLDIKASILKENLRRLAKLELEKDLIVHPSPPWNYRNRTRLKLQNSPDFAIGYYKVGSHELLPVEQCPISSPLINRAITAFWELGRAGDIKEEIQEVEFFANADDSQLLAEVYGSGVPRDTKAWTSDAQRALPELAGVSFFKGIFDPRPGAVPERIAVEGAGDLSYETPLAIHRVSAGAFFQVNRYLTDELTKAVLHGHSGNLALDLYAGVGLFSTSLARSFAQVMAVESSPTSHADLLYNLPANAKAVRATVEQYLSGPGVKLRADLMVVDPPRSGLGEKVVKAIAKLAPPQLVYVSCDPATLARDLAGLLRAGYRVEQAHLLDLFPQTYHLESIFHLAR